MVDKKLNINRPFLRISGSVVFMEGVHFNIIWKYLSISYITGHIGKSTYKG